MAEHSSGQGGRIVVGVDGSEPSKAALRWAVRQAKSVGGSVEAVTAWQHPTTPGWAPLPTAADNFENRAEKALEETLREVLGSRPPAEVTPCVREGHTARVLIDSSRGADLLVVGSRGRGGFAGMLLGSVSQHCIQHATCPVVVIRTPGG